MQQVYKGGTRWHICQTIRLFRSVLDIQQIGIFSNVFTLSLQDMQAAVPTQDWKRVMTKAVFYLVAIVLLALCGLAVIINKRVAKSGLYSKNWIKTYKVMWFVAIPFAIVCATLSYPVTDTRWIYGVPFPIALFDENKAGLESYATFLDFPSIYLNLIIWYFLPHIFLAICSFFQKKECE